MLFKFWDNIGPLNGSHQVPVHTVSFVEQRNQITLVILEIVMSRQGSSHTCYRALLCQNILPSQKRKLLFYAMVAQIILPKIMALLHFHSSEYVSPKQAANMNGEL